MLKNSLSPQPTLAGFDFRPSTDVAMPSGQSVDKQGTEGVVAPYKGDITGRTPDFLTLARNAYDSSESWHLINNRRIWSRNLAHYRSEHAPDSPIHSEANRHRSRYF